MSRFLDEDIALVRERADIVDVVSQTVTLRPAGSGTMKGLCPFHDEKTPSFTVAAARGVYFCHGCQAGGDAIKFLMETELLTFAETVQRLADQCGVQLRTDDTAGPSTGPAAGLRRRLLAAHAAAAAFYAAQLRTPAAAPAREFLAARGFGRETAQRYGCGFAPEAWDALSRHLQQQGFTADELTTAGLAKPGTRGLIDRFRRRLLWPISDITGEVIGFGARKLFDDDTGPKYLNTPETPLYKKSHVLYGLDVAKKEIAKSREVVIVEGYTDVMACHEAGVLTAVASCGTAFGAEHTEALRRLLLDTDGHGGQIVFTFDGDAAGQKAALRAFDGDQRFAGRTFIAVGPDGMDPCELRLAAGDDAVRELVRRRTPLVDFALQHVIAGFDLGTVDGRVDAMRAAAPLISKIKDMEKRPEYARVLAGRLGLDAATVLRAVGAPGPAPRPAPADAPAAGRRAVIEREVLKLALQYPQLRPATFDTLGADAYTEASLAAVRAAIPDRSAATGGAAWVETVRAGCTDPAVLAGLGALAVEPALLDGEPDVDYAAAQMAALQLAGIAEQLTELSAQLQRLDPGTDRERYLRDAGELCALQQHAAQLRAAAGR